MSKPDADLPGYAEALTEIPLSNRLISDARGLNAVSDRSAKLLNEGAPVTGIRFENPPPLSQRSKRAPKLKSQDLIRTESLAKNPNDLCRPPASTKAVILELLNVVSAL